MSTHKPIITTPAKLLELAKELHRCSTELQGVADSAAASEIDEVQVLNFDQLNRAVVFSNNFVKAARNAIWAARAKRGDFGKEVEADKPAATTKKKSK